MLQRSHASSEIRLAPAPIAALLLVGFILLHGIDILSSGYSFGIKLLTALTIIGVFGLTTRRRRRTKPARYWFLVSLALITGLLAWYPLYYWGTVATCRPALGLTFLLYIAIPSIILFQWRGYSFNVACIGAAAATVVLAVVFVRNAGSLFHQPAFHLVYGNTRMTRGNIPTILPYSKFCHFYSWNPRGAFDQSTTESISPWLAWTMFVSTDRGTSADFDHLDDSRSAIRIAVHQDPIQKLWHAIWASSHWPVRGGSICSIRFRARADEPRTLGVGVTKQYTSDLVKRGDYELTTDWKDYELNFTAALDVRLVELSFYLHPSTVPIELSDLEFECNGWRTHPLIPLSRYTMSSNCNDRGFRDRDYLVPRADNAFRIVCLGDSCTWGQGVRLEDTYSKTLERLLNQSPTSGDWKASSMNFEVINAGRCGYSTEQERLCLEQEANAYQPQIVILQMLDNDNELPGERLSREKATDYSICLRDVKRLYDYCSARRIKLVILLFRYLPMTERWRSLRETLEQGLSGRDITIVESGDAVAERLSHGNGFLLDQATVHPLDSHPNEIAHEIAARSILDALRKQRLIPESAAYR